jgi:hypothetical protein
LVCPLLSHSPYFSTSRPPSLFTKQTNADKRSTTGDGEISFGGREDVTSLVNALEGAAVNAAATSSGFQAEGKTPTIISPGGSTTTTSATNPALSEQVSVLILVFPLISLAENLSWGNLSILPMRKKI